MCLNGWNVATNPCAERGDTRHDGPPVPQPPHNRPDGFTDDTRPAIITADQRGACGAPILWLQLWLQTGHSEPWRGGAEEPNRPLTWGFVGGHGLTQCEPPPHHRRTRHHRLADSRDADGRPPELQRSSPRRHRPYAASHRRQRVRPPRHRGRSTCQRRDVRPPGNLPVHSATDWPRTRQRIPRPRGPRRRSALCTVMAHSRGLLHRRADRRTLGGRRRTSMLPRTSAPSPAHRRDRVAGAASWRDSRLNGP
jgi:hypothetical protein